MLNEAPDSNGGNNDYSAGVATPCSGGVDARVAVLVVSGVIRSKGYGTKIPSFDAKDLTIAVPVSSSLSLSLFFPAFYFGLLSLVAGLLELAEKGQESWCCSCTWPSSAAVGGARFVALQDVLDWFLLSKLKDFGRHRSIGNAEVKPILVNCGSNFTIDVDGRTWVGDLVAGNNVTLSIPGINTSVATVDKDLLGSLYCTARVFNTTSNYTFNVPPGSYFVRLHFYPFQFEGLSTNNSEFDVIANSLKLLTKYNVTDEIARKNAYLWSLKSNSSLASMVLPVLDNLFFDLATKVGGASTSFNLLDRGMETMYRVNMGDHTISNTSNISYANSSHSSAAPLLVYEDARIMSNNEVVEKKFNVTWKFNVDPNFDYLLRLHFSQGKDRAYHEDFVDTFSEQMDTLWLQLGQDTTTSASDTDALLNGLEIFKLSKYGNLAHVSEKINTGGGGFPSGGSKGKSLWVDISAGNPPVWRPLVLDGILGSTMNAHATKSPKANGSVATNRTGRRFTIMEIRAATKSFDDSLVIGTGGFGKVYKGELEDGNLVAIKRGHPQSEQGLAEFETEIEMLSKLRHRHLVSMIGYCEEQNEMILVYEYMANGTLRSHLYGSDLPPLSWKQRLDICIGAARGLHYLHTGADRGIIHRDVKTTNILLDENFVAKMADFGLSKAGPTLDRTHVSTAVKGSFGYLDPEYFRRQQLTQKSDVYSFGVVLFEVVCSRPVINPTLPKDQINLAEWAVRWERQGSLETIADPHLKGDCSLESLKKFGEIALKCLADEGKNRPTMGDVLWHLEYVLQLHETYTRIMDVDSVSSSEVRFASMSLNLPPTEEESGMEVYSVETKSGGESFKAISGDGADGESSVS
ncbi:hypothetical protein Taro_035508 [Colocasia esculenta]|uniref:Protein kinase domain-containing protein n=1 Tax=Colocasia esculenta TaxID=4460 RepID=A0A843W0M9_COLES|nr:hypothetical protein [Colocasia esculenta]